MLLTHFTQKETGFILGKRITLDLFVTNSSKNETVSFLDEMSLINQFRASEVKLVTDLAEKKLVSFPPKKSHIGLFVTGCAENGTSTIFGKEASGSAKQL